MMTNYYETRLQEINMLLQMGIESHSPHEAKKIKKEREQILQLINREDIDEELL